MSFYSENSKMLSIHLHKQFGSFKLDIKCNIKQNFTALFGRSGAGKTTILNMIAGLCHPEEGSIKLHDRFLFDTRQDINMAPQQRGIGYIFQESRLFPHMTVRQNLEYGWKNVPEKRRKFQIDDIVEEMGLGVFLHRKPQNLSGGEKQRVAFARALLSSPDFLLMDEPLAALDQDTKLRFLLFLKKMLQNYQLPILYVSHDLINVINFADEIILIRNGQLLGQGPPNEMLDMMAGSESPNHQAIPNIFSAIVSKHDGERGLTHVTLSKLELLLPLIPDKIGNTITLNIPASEIILAKQKPNALSACNVLAGKLQAIHQPTGRFLAKVDIGIPLMVEITSGALKRLDIQKGDPLFLIIKASSFKKISRSTS